MADLTPRDDIKKKVSEILKRVDQLLKGGQLDHALQQITHAKEIDPKNVYILAYEERMNAMLQERKEAAVIEEKHRKEEEVRKKHEEERRKQEEARKKVEEEVRRKEEEKRTKEEERKHKAEAEQRRAEEEKQRAKEEARQKEEEERRKQEERRKAREEEEETRDKIEERRKHWADDEAKARKGEVKDHPGPRYPEISRDVLEETKKKILDERKKRGAAKLEIDQSKSFAHAYDEGLDIYRRVLVEAWADGATTEAEEEQLKNLRESLMIRSEDHEKLDREAKIEAYATAFRRAWSSGAISPESASSLAELRRKFKINIEEHESIETKLLWELRSSNQRAQVVFVDDDEKLLRLVSDILQDAGYQTVTFTTSDEAFHFLKTNTPDLILSDINLETSTMGGFTFYEKVREIDNLHEIPFIFLSGLTDEVLVRTGKELGVDDYLTKPFADETLIATIKGKLKRYRQLRKSRQKK